jgi:hypothetical protein
LLFFNLSVEEEVPAVELEAVVVLVEVEEVVPVIPRRWVDAVEAELEEAEVEEEGLVSSSLSILSSKREPNDDFPFFPEVF